MLCQSKPSHVWPPTCLLSCQEFDPSHGWQGFWLWLASGRWLTLSHWDWCVNNVSSSSSWPTTGLTLAHAKDSSARSVCSYCLPTDSKHGRWSWRRTSFVARTNEKWLNEGTSPCAIFSQGIVDISATAPLPHTLLALEQHCFSTTIYGHNIIGVEGTGVRNLLTRGRYCSIAYGSSWCHM